MASKAKAAAIEVVPKTAKEKQYVCEWNPTEEQRDFLMEKQRRINILLESRRDHESEIREGLLLYDGKSTDLTTKDKRDVHTVMPIARPFVETKVAEQARVMNSFVFVPKPRKEKMGGAKVEILQELQAHAEYVTAMKSKRPEILRLMNAQGLCIVRTGYRKSMRKIKERVNDGEDFNEDAVTVEYKERVVPMYDDLFVDIVSPLDFAIDPLATTLQEAADCYQQSVMHIDDFKQRYGLDPRFENVDKVPAGVKFKFDPGGGLVFDRNVDDDCVVVEEYFNKFADEWVTVANGVLISPIETPLPDDHKRLPFVAYHNNTSFVNTVTPAQSSKDLARGVGINHRRSFWTKGDPVILKPMIDAQTGLIRSMIRNAKLSSEYIIATDPGYAFPTNKSWRSGDQAIGMKDKYEHTPLAQSNFPNIEPMIEFFTRLEILNAGADPNNLSAENIASSATEAAIKNETAKVRLMESIEFNEQNAEVPLGEMIARNIQQYYSKPETVRITGIEDVESFDEVVDGVVDGVDQKYGKRYRVIQSKRKFIEKRDGDKFYLSEDEKDGVNSFLARPEYIRASDMFVTVKSDRDSSQLKAITVAQKLNGINLLLQVLPLTQAQEGGQPLVDPSSLPDLGELLQDYFRLNGQETTQKEESKSEMSPELDSIDSYLQDKRTALEQSGNPLVNAAPQ